MKILLSCLTLCCLILTGCRSINTVDNDTYEALITYRDAVGREFNNYLENDKNVSEREKNVYRTMNRCFYSIINS